ncbi:MAG: SpvB/TcaC N-terminal domain-containing protein [Hellea sp.]
MTENLQTDQGPPQPSPSAQGTAPNGVGADPNALKAAREFTQLMPELSLPKSGGAIRSIGEKFTINPATGSGSMSVPIAMQGGRGAPQLGLSYDSGSGNGIFGQGWSMGLGDITRKTDKRLPDYTSKDVFVISGLEDLVQVDEDDSGAVTITTYQPRTEGSFSRIKRFTSGDEMWWETTDRNNVKRWYGAYPDGAGMVSSLHADLIEGDPERAGHVFRWLLGEERDEKGNRTRYEYKREDEAGIDPDNPSEQIRGAAVKLYIKHIHYGLMPETDGDAPEWIFRLTFDYGEHDSLNPELITGDWSYRKDPFSTYRSGYDTRTRRLCQRILQFNLMPGSGRDDHVLNMATELDYDDNAIASRVKEITHRRYRLDGSPEVYESAAMPSVSFTYSEARPDDRIHIIGPGDVAGSPSGLGGDYRFIDLDGESIAGILSEQGNDWYYRRNLGGGDFEPPKAINRPAGWASLNNGGQIATIESDGTPYLVSYGNIAGYAERLDDESWGDYVPLPQKPNINVNDPNIRWLDLNGDGRAEICLLNDEVITWYENDGIEGFQPAQHNPTGQDERKGPAKIFQNGLEGIYTTDMSGDGLVDIVRIRNGSICYWPNLGYGRFGARVEMDGAPYFGAEDEFDASRLRLGDIDGSGISDILYLAGDHTAFWLNQSGNSWSPPERLSAVPHMDHMVDVGMIDLLGNGTSCLVWSSSNAADAHAPWRYLQLMTDRDLSQVDVSDVDPAAGLLSGLIRSSDNWADLEGLDIDSLTALEAAGAKITRAVKPYLLKRVDNNMGMQTRLSYRPSTYFYLKDRAAGTPWITKMPFPVHVVDRQEIIDFVSDNRYVSRSSYHHGYYDRAEREFRGFGRVEQWDMEGTNLSGDPLFDRTPVLTRSWFHTGAYLAGPTISAQFDEEYYQSPDDTLGLLHLPDSVIEDGNAMSAKEIRQAKRALRGQALRAEIYACKPLEEGQDKPVTDGAPYQVTESRFRVKMLRPAGDADSEPGIFFSIPEETLTQVLETNPDDPRIAHQMTLQSDDFGQAVLSAQIAYGRRKPSSDPFDPQTKSHIVISHANIVNKDQEAEWYRLGIPVAGTSWELGNALDVTQLARPADILSKFNSAVAIKDRRRDLVVTEIGGIDVSEKRLLSANATLFRGNAKSELGLDATPLDLGDVESLALPCRSYAMVFSPEDVKAADGNFDDNDFIEGHYIDPLTEHPSYSQLQTFLSGLPETDAIHSGWWARDNETALSETDFYAPIKVRDSWGTISRVDIDPLSLTATATHLELPLDDTTTVTLSTSAELDYRLMAPRSVTGPNGNRQEARFDVLGRPIQTAIIGSAGEGDQLDSLEAFDESSAATSWMTYEFYKNPNEPAYVHSYSRETHHSELPSGETPRWMEARIYSDGFGREVLSKAKAAKTKPTKDEDGKVVEGVPQWLSSARTVFDNKGNPVLQYEPYFTPNELYADGPEARGVTPILYYDAMDRVVRTELPDGTQSRTVFTPWEQESWDALDCIDELIVRDDVLRWRDNPVNADAIPDALLHKDTPAIQYLDSLGRPYKTQIKNYNPNDDSLTPITSSVEIDITGNVLRTIDALEQTALEEWFDRAGRPIKSISNDAGTSYGLTAMDGQPRLGLGANLFRVEQLYDALRRPTEYWVTDPDGNHYIREKTIYAEDPDFTGSNGLGQAWKVYDACGMAEVPDYDFKGMPISSTRHILADLADVSKKPDAFTDWQTTHNFGESVSTSSLSDALGRPVQIIAPDGSVQKFTYDEGGALFAVSLKDVPGNKLEQDTVTAIWYDSKGRRERIAYGNLTETNYSYDPDSFRLTSLRTLKGSKVFQDLSYSYDPLGNIIKIEDIAGDPTPTFGNIPNPPRTYKYDSLSRLVEAKGREHFEQVGGRLVKNNPDGMMKIGARDVQGLKAYTERWDYDDIGNIDAWYHSGPELSQNWTRDYIYNNRGGALGTNQLNETKIKRGDDTFITEFKYDAAGNIYEMGHITDSVWNVDDHPEHMVLHKNQDAHYRYDGAGERLFKRIDKSAGGPAIRLYLGGFEIYRKYNASGSISLRRDSLHIMDGESRILMIETEKSDDDIKLHAAAPAYRWQYADHLGSSAIELDSNADILSYEEMHAYGTTSWHWTNGKVSQKRYRYTGMERDGESGLQYHSARYYLPWVGRWLSTDPLGMVDGACLWAYVRGNPVGLNDITGKLADQEILSEGKNNKTESRVAENIVLEKDSNWRKESISSPPPLMSDYTGAAGIGVNNLEKLKKIEPVKKLVPIVIVNRDFGEQGGSPNEGDSGHIDLIFPTSKDQDFKFVGFYGDATSTIDALNAPGFIVNTRSEWTRTREDYITNSKFESSIFVIMVTQEQVNNMVKRAKEIDANPPDYELIGNNCASVAADILYKGGVINSDEISGFDTPSNLVEDVYSNSNDKEFEQSSTYGKTIWKKNGGVTITKPTHGYDPKTSTTIKIK